MKYEMDKQKKKKNDVIPDKSAQAQLKFCVMLSGANIEYILLRTKKTIGGFYENEAIFIDWLLNEIVMI